MGTHHETMMRREQVSICLSKSMTSTKMIAAQIGATVPQVDNDLRWMRKSSRKWLSGHTLDGYIFETRKAIDQISDIIMDLQAMRSKENDIDRKLRIMHELADKINMKWVMQGDGPTLMHINTVKDNDGR